MRALHYALATEKAYLAARRDRTPPTTPANFRVTEVSPTSVSIAWNPSSDNSGSFFYVLSTNTVTVMTLQPDPNDHTPPSTPTNLSENDFGDAEFWLRRDVVRGLRPEHQLRKLRRIQYRRGNRGG
jgi:hypothetical protein